MSGRIPQAFIDDLLSRTDIVDVIDNFVPLRKAGKNHQALCPFHDEKTPSFTVNQDKQFYHCFGCGASGTAISFLMEFGHMDFVEAIHDLAAKAGLEVPREGGPVAAKEEGQSALFELMELVVRYYRTQLREHPEAQQAVSYLKNRGITGELAAEFELGYAPPGWDNLLKQFGQSEAARKRLASIGMTIERDEGGFYDRFRNRIMFPIRDQRGRAIGFGGRVLDDGTPKYLNSPETPIFHKGKELYGLYQARHKSPADQPVFIVEGYMDVLALAQHKLPNVVATLGTAATADQLSRMFRHTSRLIFCFDGDEAGKKAAWRAMETALPLLRDGRQAFFMFLPDGMDPDDYVRKHGPETFADSRKLTPLSDYLLDTVKAQNDLGSREGRSRFVDQTTPLVSRLPQGGLRQILLRDIAGVAKTAIDDIEPLARKPDLLPKKHKVTYKRQGQDRTPVTSIIELILFRPQLALRIEDPAELKQIPAPGADFLRELIELVHARPQINCAGIIENWRGSKYEGRLTEIAANSDERTSELTDPDSELLDAYRKLMSQRDKHLRQKLSNIERMSDLTDQDRERLRRPHLYRDSSTDD